MAQIVRIPDQFLAIKAGHHAVLERLLVTEQLGEHSAQLKMILAEVPQFEQFARYVELLQLLFWREVKDGAVPATLRKIIRHC